MVPVMVKKLLRMCKRMQLAILCICTKNGCDLTFFGDILQGAQVTKSSTSRMGWCGVSGCQKSDIFPNPCPLVVRPIKRFSCNLNFKT